MRVKFRKGYSRDGAGTRSELSARKACLERPNSTADADTLGPDTLFLATTTEYNSADVWTGIRNLYGQRTQRPLYKRRSDGRRHSATHTHAGARLQPLPDHELTGASCRRRQPTIGLDALAAYSAIRVAFQDEADHDQRQKRDRVHKFGVRRTGRATTMHRSDKRILRMEARRKNQKALQDSCRRRTDNEPCRRMGHVATGIKTSTLVVFDPDDGSERIH